MATVTPNFGWPVPTSTDLVKDGATAMEALGDAIDTSMVDLKGGTTGQVLAKASNTDMDFSWVAQDDSNAIQNSIVDAKGDLIAASAADTPARLAVGANGQILMADSTTATGLKYSRQTKFSGARVYKSGTQSLSNNVAANVTFDTEQYDTDGYHSLTTNTERLTVPFAGWYRFYGQIAFGTSAVGGRFIGLGISNVFNLVFGSGTPNAVDRVIVNLSGTIELAAGDFVSIFALQSSGGALNVVGGIAESVLEVEYIGV